MLQRLITIFLYGLFFQFFLYNRVTFWLDRNQPWMKIVRLWKEVFIGIFCIVVLRKPGIKAIRQKLMQPAAFSNDDEVGVITRSKALHLWEESLEWRLESTWRTNPSRFKRWIIIFLITIIRVGITHFFFLNQPVATFILGLKYDFLGFLLVLLGYLMAITLKKDIIASILKGYMRFLKYVLLGAIVRYFIILIKPGTLKFFWYNNYIYEGQAGGEAPAAYYTHINQGIPRNQFLFERPTTRGFFLTAMWPLFYMRYLANQPISYTRWRRAIYGINILLTFSRAARWARFLEIWLLWFFLHKEQRKSYLKKFLLPMMVIALVVWGLWFKQIIARGYSNRGHITMIKQGVELFLQHPWIGLGLASVGPGSHWIGWLAFNPENQFLQILIELWIIGFVGWMLLFVWMNWVWLQPVVTSRKLLALSIAMLGLSISGLVLHSFVDRMVVYPFCLLFGIILAWQEKDLQA